MKNTARLISRLRKRILTEAVISEALTSVLASLGFLLVFSVADLAFILPGRLLKLPAYFALAAVVFAAARIVLRCRPYFLSDVRTIVFAQERIPALGDELLSAWQLSRAPAHGVSRELIAALCEKMEAAAAALDIPAVQPLVTMRVRRAARLAIGGLGIFGLLYLLPPGITKTTLDRVLFSLSSSNWDRYFTLTPGDRSLPFGASAEITIEGKQLLGGEPVLRLRAEGGPWRKVSLISPGAGKYSFAVDQLSNALSYRAEWSDIGSPVFKLVPVMYPQLGDFSVTYAYPSYTGLAPREARGSAAIAAIAGTKVTVRARSTKLLKGAVLKNSWGGDSAIETDKDRLTARFTLSESGAYRIEAEGIDGTIDPGPAEYPVSVTKDASPEVELLSPVEDLIVSPQAEIPLVGEASDDLGLKRVELVYRVDEGKAGRVAVASPEKGVSRQSFEYLWRAGELNARPGARIRYYLEAWDNDTSAGPKSSVTPTRVIEITDYEREHEAIGDDLRGIKEKLLGLLADQSAVRERTRSLETAFSAAAFNAAAEGQRAVKDRTREPVEMLKKALSRMENDPLTDLGTLGEYKGLASYLERLSGGPMTAASDALGKNDFAAAGRSQDEVIASLEKLALLSEDIWRYQKMRDVMDAGSELKDASARLKERVAEGAKPEDLAAALDRIDELMGKIARQLSKFPKELPEDFVNSPAVKKIDMQAYEDQAGRLREAIERGDWQSARELADSLAGGLEGMLGMLEQAGKDIGFDGASSGAMQKQVREYGERLEAIRKKQAAIQARIEEMDGVRQKALFAGQEKTLDDLARRQKEITRRAEALKKEALAHLSPAYLYLLDRAIPLMIKVSDEFSRRRAFNSQKYLEDIIASLSDQGRIVSAGSVFSDAEAGKNFAGENAAIQSGEKEILEALRNDAPAGLFSPGQEESLKGIAKEEDALAVETDRFRNSLEEFTRRSTALDAGTFDNIAGAAAEMRSAGETLSRTDTKAGREHGQKALDYLSETQRSLGSAAEAMAGRGGRAGRPVPGRMQVRSGGTTGFRSVPVKLPRINEYKPPREFRQEILDALKEKYPKQYDKIIKEYFRKLTE